MINTAFADRSHIEVLNPLWLPVEMWHQQCQILSWYLLPMNIEDTQNHCRQSHMEIHGIISKITITSVVRHIITMASVAVFIKHRGTVNIGNY
jgi:hypothetical protein